MLNGINVFHSGVQLRDRYSGNTKDQNGSDQVQNSNTENRGMVVRSKQAEITRLCGLLIIAKRIRAGFRKVCSLTGLSNRLKEQRCKH